MTEKKLIRRFSNKELQSLLNKGTKKGLSADTVKMLRAERSRRERKK